MASDEHAGEVAQELIDALAREGQLVDDGSFTLDPHKAREKLRAFQLQDPHAYVLLLVEAAHIAGSSMVELSCGPTTQAVFSGMSLTSSQLENVFNAVFVDASGIADAERDAARLQQLLGIAANAALSLGPRRIEIENVDAQGRLNRLTIHHDGGIELGADGEGPAARTRFVFCGEGEDERDDREVALLRERCRYSNYPISVYGRWINEGPRALMLGRRSVRVRLESGEIIGRAGWSDDTSKARALVLTRGVLSETITLKGRPRGLVAVVEVDLRKDLSQSTVLRGSEFDEVMAAVDRAFEKLGRYP